MANKLPLDPNYDLEQQFILRMTDVAAAQNLLADIEAGVSFKENFTIEFKPDMRHAIVRYNGQVYQGRIMDLPCIIESLKTTDKKNFYKTADICQMMICTQDDESGPLRGTAAYLDNQTGSHNKPFDTSRENREFQFLHGITPPLKNVLRRRFRKSRKKRFVDMPKIEKEVKQLLRADLQAVTVKWEVIWTDPPVPASRNPAVGSTSTDDMGHALSGANMSGADSQTNRQVTADDELDEDDEEGTRAYAIDHRDVFGEISSSSIGSSDSSNASEDEHDESEAKRDRSGLTRSVGRGVGGGAAAAAMNSIGDRTQKPTAAAATTATPTSRSATDPEGLGTLKDVLAAELLLSDSGEEDADDEAHDDEDNDDDNVEHSGLGNPEDGGGGGVEDDIQANVAAQLVAHAGPTSEDVGQDVDDVDDFEDEDDIVPRGGELLDDSAFMSYADLDHAVVSYGDEDEDNNHGVDLEDEDTL